MTAAPPLISRGSAVLKADSNAARSAEENAEPSEALRAAPREIAKPPTGTEAGRGGKRVHLCICRDVPFRDVFF